MARTRLFFCGEEGSSSEYDRLEVYANQEGSITVFIEKGDGTLTFVDFDKATAIRLSKELRKQIGLITENQTITETITEKKPNGFYLDSKKESEVLK